jgi:hypothetical protein
MKKLHNEGQGNVWANNEVPVEEKTQRSPWAGILGPKDINKNSRYNLIGHADLEPVVKKIQDALNTLGAGIAPIMLEAVSNSKGSLLDKQIKQITGEKNYETLPVELRLF